MVSLQSDLRTALLGTAKPVGACARRLAVPRAAGPALTGGVPWCRQGGVTGAIPGGRSDWLTRWRKVLRAEYRGGAPARGGGYAAGSSVRDEPALGRPVGVAEADAVLGDAPADFGAADEVKAESVVR